MGAGDRQKVLARLQDLEGWAEYVFEALHLDQESEPMRQGMLERTVEHEALRQLREVTWSLRDQLHRITTELELSHSVQESIA
jgi:hypothetical protein